MTSMSTDIRQPVAIFNWNTAEQDHAPDGLTECAWRALFGALATAAATGSRGAKTTDVDGVDYNAEFGSEVGDGGVRRRTQTVRVYVVDSRDRRSMAQAHRMEIEQYITTIRRALDEVADARERYDLPDDLLGEHDPFPGGLASVEEAGQRFRAAADALRDAYDHGLGDPVRLLPMSQVQP